MAPESHPQDREDIITRSCSDPDFVSEELGFNPVVRLINREKHFRRYMEAVDCDVEGYAIATFPTAELLVAYDPFGTIIGGMMEKRIFVLPDHRGFGIGAEMLIRAFEIGVMHPRTMNIDNALTTAGRANRRAAHRIAVEKAVRAGIDVDPEILADYADFVQAWSSPTRPHLSAPKTKM